MLFGPLSLLLREGKEWNGRERVWRSRFEECGGGLTGILGYLLRLDKVPSFSRFEFVEVAGFEDLCLSRGGELRPATEPGSDWTLGLVKKRLET